MESLLDLLQLTKGNPWPAALRLSKHILKEVQKASFYWKMELRIQNQLETLGSRIFVQ